MKLWYVYMILMKNNNIYTGYSKDFITRFIQHYKGIGSKTTKRYGIKYIIHLEYFKEKNMAIKREKEIKTFSKNKKLSLLNNENIEIYKDLCNIIISNNNSNLNILLLIIIKKVKLKTLNFIGTIIEKDEIYSNVIEKIIKDM